ncbi:hypothetical protein [Candidatus Venteria ishoeyi]|uniref:Uncharacterized protein n=1 Tax=Candidatus Venteria ishoeyi TaxID=1899563 RepID=A0A1H6F3I9_9GAMM|nr:hypothetical protein [Candidatus Venteria ishoeyi]SEH04717.1 Uncharacterised protein [Candidatus Venteria ishoeyi]
MIKRFILLIILLTHATITYADLLTVTGTGLERFYVYDALDKELKGQANTNETLNLPSGSYSIHLHDVTQQVTLTGQNLTVQTGTLQMDGSGHFSYSVYDEFERERYGSTSYTHESMALLPGKYVAVLNDSKQTFTITAKNSTVLTPGYITVKGTGQDSYYVYNEFGRDIKGSSLYTNKTKEIFAGTYQLSLNGSTTLVTVEPGKTTEVSAGQVRLNGIGLNYYHIYDELGIALLNYSSRKTNEICELFAGAYTLRLNGINQAVTVNTGALTETDAGLLIIPGIDQDSYFLSDTQNQRLSYSTYKAGRRLELFPATYTLKNSTTDVTQNITLTADLSQMDNADFSAGYAAAITRCKTNPSACSIHINATQSTDTQAGISHCQQNPDACGLFNQQQLDSATADAQTAAQTEAQEACATDPASCGITSCEQDPGSCGLFTQQQIESAETTAQTEAQQACATDPASCGITSCEQDPGSCGLFTQQQIESAETTVQTETRQACAANPISCGITTAASPSPAAILDMTFKLHVPELIYQPLVGEAQNLWADFHFYNNSPEQMLLFELQDYGINP